MPIMWQQMKNILKKYFDNGRYDRGGSYSIDNTIQYIVNTYKSFVIGKAQDPMGNRIIVFEPSSLYQSLKIAFNSAFKSTNDTGVDFINSPQTTSGIVIDWTKSTVDFSIPHPGTYIPISNIIISGGKPFEMHLSRGGNKTKDEFSENIISALQRNAATVQGIYTGIAIGTGPSFPTVPAVPLPVAWVGIN